MRDHDRARRVAGLLHRGDPPAARRPTPAPAGRHPPVPIARQPHEQRARPVDLRHTGAQRATPRHGLVDLVEAEPPISDRSPRPDTRAASPAHPVRTATSNTSRSAWKSQNVDTSIETTGIRIPLSSARLPYVHLSLSALKPARHDGSPHGLNRCASLRRELQRSPRRGSATSRIHESGQEDAKAQDSHRALR